MPRAQLTTGRRKREASVMKEHDFPPTPPPVPSATEMRSRKLLYTGIEEGEVLNPALT